MMCEKVTISFSSFFMLKGAEESHDHLWLVDARCCNESDDGSDDSIELLVYRTGHLIRVLSKGPGVYMFRLSARAFISHQF